jgi:RHS repeat-associated protein
MAGDEITAQTIYYYQNNVTNQAGGPSFVSDVLVSLAQAISGSPITSGVTKSVASNITTQLGSSVPFGSFVNPDYNDASGNNPKAYLGILYFDERFNLVEEGSLTKRVVQSGNGAAPLVLLQRKAPKNGYALVYVCNESDEVVYFDNLQVTHNRGRIMEENHYYAYGLKIAGISSRKLTDPGEGDVNNKHLYNDKELIDEGGLDWYDYGFRNYDAQIGRFTQLDPLTFDYPFYTPYQYAGCEPIGNTDLDGAEPSPKAAGFAEAIKALPGVQAVNFAYSTRFNFWSVIWNSGGVSHAMRFPQKMVSDVLHQIWFTPGMSRLIPHATTNSPSDWMGSQVPRPMLPAPARAPIPYERPATLSQYNAPTPWQQTQNAQALSNIYQDMGLNPDGSKPWLMRVSEDKHFNSFADNLVFPLMEGASFAVGAGEVYEIYKGAKVLGTLSRARSVMYGMGPKGGGFGALMEEAEAARYAKYWESYAPKQISPGTTRYDFLRVSGRTGRLEDSRVIYDQFGRQQYRIDFSNHMRPLDHSTPHLHEYIYNSKFQGKEQVFNFFN